jgi:hypothetical protein
VRLRGDRRRGELLGQAHAASIDSP